MKKVVIIGVGALGSHLLQFLRNEEASWLIIDFDRVELKNTLSQFYGKPGVGKLKVEALKQMAQFYFGLKVEAVPHRLNDGNADVLFMGADLVIDCLDNAASRRLVRIGTQLRHTPCLHGALAADGGFGRVVWDEQFVIDDEAGAGAATCTNGDHLPFIVLVAAHMARAVQAFLRTGKKLGYSISPTGTIPI